MLLSLSLLLPRRRWRKTTCTFKSNVKNNTTAGLFKQTGFMSFIRANAYRFSFFASQCCTTRPCTHSQSQVEAFIGLRIANVDTQEDRRQTFPSAPQLEDTRRISFYVMNIVGWNAWLFRSDRAKDLMPHCSEELVGWIRKGHKDTQDAMTTKNTCI